MTFKIVASCFLCVIFLGCTSMKYAGVEKQKKVQQQLMRKMVDDDSKRASRHKKLFDALKKREEYEQVSYTKEKIDKYFETTNNRQSLDELDEVYEEIEKTKR